MSNQISEHSRFIILPYIGSVSLPAKSISSMADSDNRTPIKEIEDKIIKFLSEQGDKEDGVKAVLYKHLYNGGLRISSVEAIIRKYFK